MADNVRGSIIRQGNTMRINNAFVEDVTCFDRVNGSILISYSERRNQITTIQNLQLNVNRYTILLNQSGRRMGLCQLRPNTWVDAVFSSRMTRSIPPQAYAFFVATRRQPQRPPTDVTIGQIAFNDTFNGVLITGDPNNPNAQIRFLITDTTRVLDRFGRPIGIQQLRRGQRVRITHANYMTASVPPQTTAFQIQLL
ncbi:MAG: hypothetical protein ACOYBE_04525 [Blautia sp.]|jgi:hypothetical protein